MSKPEAAFAYCSLSTVQSKPRVKDFILLKKTVRNLQSQDWKILIRQIDIKNPRMCVFCDASHANLSGGASQIGYIIFVHDDSGNCVPLTWVSKKARRVARSTLAAETLSAADAADCAIFLKHIIEEIIDIKLPPVTVFVDNKSLHDAVKSTGLISERRLIIELASLREMQEESKISVKWIPTTEQIADSLTKAGASKQRLINVLSRGHLELQKLLDV